jgi:hypothetical protein
MRLVAGPSWWWCWGGGFEVEKRVWKLFISSVRQRGREESKPGRRCSRVRIWARKSRRVVGCTQGRLRWWQLGKGRRWQVGLSGVVENHKKNGF